MPDTFHGVKPVIGGRQLPVEIWADGINQEYHNLILELSRAELTLMMIVANLANTK